MWLKSSTVSFDLSNAEYLASQTLARCHWLKLKIKFTLVSTLRLVISLKNEGLNSSTTWPSTELALLIITHRWLDYLLVLLPNKLTIHRATGSSTKGLHDEVYGSFHCMTNGYVCGSIRPPPSPLGWNLASIHELRVHLLASYQHMLVEADYDSWNQYPTHNKINMHRASRIFERPDIDVSM